MYNKCNTREKAEIIVIIQSPVELHGASGEGQSMMYNKCNGREKAEIIVIIQSPEVRTEYYV